MGFNTKGSDNRVHEKRKKHKKDEKILKNSNKSKDSGQFHCF